MEAAWKYLIICSVGITLALLSIRIVYASSIIVLGESSSALDWSTLMAVAGSLDPTLLKIAFIFILIGYGTRSAWRPCTLGCRTPIPRPPPQFPLCCPGPVELCDVRHPESST